MSERWDAWKDSYDEWKLRGPEEDGRRDEGECLDCGATEEDFQTSDCLECQICGRGKAKRPEVEAAPAKQASDDDIPF